MPNPDQNGTMANRWSNETGSDEWHVEVEPDRFSEDEPMCVSVWIEGVEAETEREFDALATPTPAQARELAKALVFFADYVDKHNAVALDEERPDA